MPKGNKSAARGKPVRVRRRITKAAALELKLIAWQRYGRPTTDEEEDTVLVALIHEEAERATQDA